MGSHNIKKSSRDYFESISKRKRQKRVVDQPPIDYDYNAPVFSIHKSNTYAQKEASRIEN